MALLVLSRAIDARGKDGTIRSVFTGVNPQGVRVVSWKVPNDVEQSHDYLWRIHRELPAKGEMVIFNRSHYEDVLVVRVNQLVAESRWHKRYRHINEFERMLTDEGTVIVKITCRYRGRTTRTVGGAARRPPQALEVQARRPRDARALGGLHGRVRRRADRDLDRGAPWYVVPGDREWVRNTAVARLLIRTIEDLKPAFPPVSGARKLKII